MRLRPECRSALERQETREWLDSLDYVIQEGGPERTTGLLDALQQHARQAGVTLPFTANTPYVNTIPAEAEPPLPGSREIERRIKSLVRWNAMAMVVRANRESEGIGGHISTYASAATLYEVGFNHFFRGKDGRRRRRTSSTSRATPRRASTPARSSRAGCHRAAARELPPRAEARGRAVVLPAPVADARLLGVPDRLDGARPDHRDLPGALHPLPRGPRPEGAVRLGRSGRSWATARPTSPRRSAPSRWPRARSSTT